jgi:hypothetical protein
MSHIAEWDGAAWSALGSGTDAPVLGLIESGDNLFAGGEFGSAGAKSSRHIGWWTLPPHGTAAGAGVRLSSLRLEPFPNPFDLRASLSFHLPVRGSARLTVHDIEGRRITKLVDGVQEPGDHSVTWEGRDASGRPVAAGIYFVRLESAGETLTRKILRLR